MSPIRARCKYRRFAGGVQYFLRHQFVAAKASTHPALPGSHTTLRRMHIYHMVKEYATPTYTAAAVGSLVLCRNHTATAPNVTLKYLLPPRFRGFGGGFGRKWESLQTE